MSERLRRVVNRPDVRPGDRFLEIGCGHGVAATLVCELGERRFDKAFAASSFTGAGELRH